VSRKVGFAVWDGKSRGASDSTAHFLKLVTEAQFQKEVIDTLRNSSADQ
jgi:hypothetical protein